MSIIALIIKRDVKLAFQKGGGVIGQLMFMVIAASMFPFGIGADSEILQRVAPGIIMVLALFSSIISIPRMYEDDFTDGSLEQLYLTGQMPAKIVLAKIIANWLTSSLPILIVLPLICAFFDISGQGLLRLFIAVLLATPTFSMISNIGAALTIGLRKANAVINIIVLPLYIPIIIFAASAAVSGNFNEYMVIFGLSLFMLPVSVASGAFAVRVSLG